MFKQTLSIFEKKRKSAVIFVTDNCTLRINPDKKSSASYGQFIVNRFREGCSKTDILQCPSLKLLKFIIFD